LMMVLFVAGKMNVTATNITQFGGNKNDSVVYSFDRSFGYCRIYRCPHHI